MNSATIPEKAPPGRWPTTNPNGRTEKNTMPPSGLSPSNGFVSSSVAGRIASRTTNSSTKQLWKNANHRSRYASILRKSPWGIPVHNKNIFFQNHLTEQLRYLTTSGGLQSRINQEARHSCL